MSALTASSASSPLAVTSILDPRSAANIKIPMSERPLTLVDRYFNETSLLNFVKHLTISVDGLV